MTRQDLEDLIEIYGYYGVHYVEEHLYLVVIHACKISPELERKVLEAKPLGVVVEFHRHGWKWPYHRARLWIRKRLGDLGVWSSGGLFDW